MNYFISILVFFLFLSAQDGFEDYKKQEKANFQEFKDEFDNLQDYRDRDSKDYSDYLRGVYKVWGDNTVSTRKRWVNYTKDKKARAIFDFEKNEATIEVTGVKNRKEALKKAKFLMKNMEQVKSGGNSIVRNSLGASLAKNMRQRHFNSESRSIRNDLPSGESIRNQLLKGESIRKRMDTGVKSIRKQAEKLGNIRNQNKSSGSIRKQMDRGKSIRNRKNHERSIEKESNANSSGKKRDISVYKITLPYKRGAFAERSKKVIPYVKKYAKKFGINPIQVMAQIHTESAFNPRAQSPVNAFGLMQLVPRSGGGEAYRFVTKKKGKPSKSYLFNPEHNIELGCAYIYIIQSRYFGGISNSKKLELLSISAYNTGPGNVAKAFTGKYNPQKAYPQIKRLNKTQLYEHLRRKLPYKETRHYIKTVTDRMKIYGDL